MTPTGRRIGVLGGGGLATALALAAARAGSEVALWPEDTGLAAEIRKTKANARHLPGVKLPAAVRVEDEARDAAVGLPVLLLATTRAQVRPILRELGGELTGDQILIHAVAGIAAEQGGIRRTSEMIRQECCVKKIGCLSGPDLPEEIASARPTGMVVASSFHEVVDAARAALGKEPVQIFETDDLVGVELASALTDAYAIAAGIVAGLGFGTHTMAYVLTRSLVEMATLGGALGAEPATFSGLAGIGRLFAAATGETSPHRRLGLSLAKAKNPARAVAAVPAAGDAVRTVAACAAHARARRIIAPVLVAIQDILTGKCAAAAAARHLMESPPGSDAPVAIPASGASQPLAPPGGQGKS